jgi:NAD-dependent deacetylase
MSLDDFDAARKWVDEAERISVLTGAGISTDSGIPDFRGPNGVWTKNPGAEKTATLSHYMSNPDVRRQAWRNRVESPMWDAQPNTGHLAIAALEKTGKVIAVITQNVDGLHLKAGSDPDRLIEVHGNTREVVCMQCGETAPMERALDRVRQGEEDPPCRTCGGILKSATISFGQNLVEDDLIRADHAARSCDLLLAVGSTLGVYPVAGVVPIAKRHGARIVIINAERTEMDDIADAVLRGPISELLPALVGMSTP